MRVTILRRELLQLADANDDIAVFEELKELELRDNNSETEHPTTSHSDG